MVMHYYFDVSPVYYSDYDSLHKVYLENIYMLKWTLQFNFKIEL